MFLLSLLLIVGPFSCSGQEISFGSCEDYKVNVVQDFDLTKYLGLWYELKRYEAVFQYGSDCVTANYSLGSNNRVKVVNRAKFGRHDISITGEAWQLDSKQNEAKLLVQFPRSPRGKYWVIGTDYENYSVVWSCTNILFNHLQFLWILGRQPKVPDDVMKKVNQILIDAKLNMTKLRVTNNDPNFCGLE